MRRCIVLHDFIFSIIGRRVALLLVQQTGMNKQLNNFIVITGSPLLVLSPDWSRTPGYPLIKSNLFVEMFSSGSKIFN